MPPWRHYIPPPWSLGDPRAGPRSLARANPLAGPPLGPLGCVRTCRAASFLCAAGTRFACNPQDTAQRQWQGSRAVQCCAVYERVFLCAQAHRHQPVESTGAAGTRAGQVYSMSLFASVLFSPNSWPAIRRMSACMQAGCRPGLDVCPAYQGVRHQGGRTKAGALVRATCGHSRYRLST
jgi:hypothetical protein